MKRVIKWTGRKSRWIRIMKVRYRLYRTRLKTNSYHWHY